MDWIFRPVIDKWEPLGTKVGKYMDDVAVATSTNLDDHIKCVMEILELAMRYCYVLVERSARLELDGYDSVVWHVVLEACASSTL